MYVVVWQDNLGQDNYYVKMNYPHIKPLPIWTAHWASAQWFSTFADAADKIRYIKKEYPSYIGTLYAVELFEKKTNPYTDYDRAMKGI